MSSASPASAPLSVDRTSGARHIVGRTASWDALLLLTIFASGATVGSRYVAAFRQVDHQEFGQAEFGAAVALACGRGYVNPIGAPGPLADFLARRVDTFSCAQLSSNLPIGPLNITQRLYRYLMTAVAWWWRWSGVSWSRLDPVFGVAFALTLCAAYGLYRLAAGPILALILVVPLAFSAYHLANLPHLRDYAKAPFMLSLLWVMARMAMPPLDRRRCLLLSAAFGAVLGVGLGFRNDLLINLAPFLAVTLLLLPGSWRANLGLKSVCLAVALATFIAFAWPVLTAYRSGSNTGHVAVLGLVSSFDGPLDLTRPAYDLGSAYSDATAATLIDAHSRLKSGHFVDYLSPAYDKAAVGLLADAARHWPADILVRAYASALRMFDFPFTVGQYGRAVPHGVSSPWLLRGYEWQGSILQRLSGLGPVLVVLALVSIGASDPRAAVALVVLLIFYCGYPALQFDIRHFFHLEFIAWWALGFVAVVAARAVRAMATFRGLPFQVLARAARGVAITGVAILSTALLLWTLRVYQQRHLTTLFDMYLASSRTPVKLSPSGASGITVFGVEGLWLDGDAREPVAIRYLVVEFGAEQCGAVDLPVGVKYLAPSGTDEPSELARIPITSGGPTFRLLPVYSRGPQSRFAGLGLPTGSENCLKSVSAIDDLGRIPLLVNLTLTPDWRSSSLYQRLASWEPGWTSDARAARVQPADLVVPVESRLVRVWSPEADTVAPGVTRSARGWVARVTDAGPQQWMVHFPPQPVEPGMLFKASGVLQRGSLAVGITQDGQWAAVRTVTAPGPFTVLIRAPSAGPYGPLVENYSTLPWRDDRRSLLRRAVHLIAPGLLVEEFELYEVAWVRPPSPAE